MNFAWKRLERFLLFFCRAFHLSWGQTKKNERGTKLRMRHPQLSRLGPRALRSADLDCEFWTLCSAWSLHTTYFTRPWRNFFRSPPFPEQRSKTTPRSPLSRTETR